MTDKTQTIADPFADLLRDKFVCECGSCREALDGMLAEFQRYAEDTEKCPAWYVAHLTASAVMLTILVRSNPETYSARVQLLSDHFTTHDALEYISQQYEAVVDKLEAGEAN